MTALNNALGFFRACESSQGWTACEPYIEPDAAFECQASPVAEFDRVRQYVDWMEGVSAWMTDGRFDIHSTAWDDERRIAVVVATFTGHHDGEGGPLPPTNQQMQSHYVFVMHMNEDDRVEKVRKVWNAHWAMTQLGWV